MPVFVALLTLAVFLPALQNGFVNWDDDKNLLNNPNYRGLGRTELHWMFTTVHLSLYRPLAWVSLGLDHLFWGMDPFGYHLTSLVLHVINAVLFYFLALRLFCLATSGSGQAKNLGLRLAAGYAALVFALHPLRVEPVAWASARNDVLSGLFFLCTLLCYLSAATGGKRGRWLSLAVAFCALSLLSKATAMTLPLVLLVLDVYPLRRLGSGNWFAPEVRKIWWEKIPFMLLGVGAAVIAIVAKSESGAMISFARYGIAPRIAQALYGLAFYLWKTLLPFGLSPLYEMPSHLSAWDFPYLLSGAVVLALSVIFFVARRSWPAGLGSWIYYILLLIPVLGIAQSGPQFVADRYTYLSCFPWAVLAGVGILFSWRAIRWRSWAIALSTGVLVALSVLTWQQARIWRDSESLWRHAVATEPESSIARNNFGNALFRRGNVEEAVEYYRQALRLDPLYRDAHYNLATALAIRREFREAMIHFREALQMDPSNADVHYSLANALVTQDDLDGAAEHYREALKLDPGRSEIYFDLGNVLARQGHLDRAVENFHRALRLKPDFAQAHNNLGRVLAAQGDLTQAVEHFQEALHIDPEFAEGHESLAFALVQQGRKEEAARHYEEALRILKASRQGGARP